MAYVTSLTYLIVFGCGCHLFAMFWPAWRSHRPQSLCREQSRWSWKYDFRICTISMKRCGIQRSCTMLHNARTTNSGGSKACARRARDNVYRPNASCNVWVTASVPSTCAIGTWESLGTDRKTRMRSDSTAVWLALVHTRIDLHLYVDKTKPCTFK